MTLIEFAFLAMLASILLKKNLDSRQLAEILEQHEIAHYCDKMDKLYAADEKIRARMGID